MAKKFKTNLINMYIHELPTKGLTTNPKKSGKPSRPARGERIGVAVAQVTSDETYAVNVSITNPGTMAKGGEWTPGDVFNARMGNLLVLGKIAMGEPMPHIAFETPTTKRAVNIKKQVDFFRLQASKVFKDKVESSIMPEKQMVRYSQGA